MHAVGFLASLAFAFDLRSPWYSLVLVFLMMMA